MCELLGISSNAPIEARDVLRAFRQRGGGTADNRDGWGIAFRAGGGFRLLKEPVPAVQSAGFGALCESLRSDLIVAHVRKARHPPISTLVNTHPFEQVCCGTKWVFAHNGLVPEIVEAQRSSRDPVCRPAGETDSEHAFCRVLAAVAEHFSAAAPVSGRSWFDAVAAASELVASHGQFNFLMSDGEYLIAYGHDRLHHVQRRAPAAPGTLAAEVVIIATEPLTADAGWQPFEPGELRIYRFGRLTERIKTTPPLAQQDAERSRAGVVSIG
jgi:glutamine amidotransferase